MKLFIEEKNGVKKTGKIIYLDKIASTRRDLQTLIGSKEFTVNQNRYYISQAN